MSNKLAYFLNFYVLQWFTIRAAYHFEPDDPTKVLGYCILCNVAPLSGWDGKPLKKAFVPVTDSWTHK
jgi:hypothetical protein